MAQISLVVKELDSLISDASTTVLGRFHDRLDAVGVLVSELQ